MRANLVVADSRYRYRTLLDHFCQSGMVFADAHADPPGLTALEVTSTRRRILGVAYLDRYKATGVIQIISNQTLTFVS